MPRDIPPKERIAEFKDFMNRMTAMRLDVLSANATKYAETLGAVRAALVKSGFSAEESMQLVLQLAEPRRPMHWRGRSGHWQK